jgi:hypothetical protein
MIFMTASTLGKRDRLSTIDKQRIAAVAALEALGQCDCSRRSIV